MNFTITHIVLLLWALLIIAAMFQYGGVLQSLHRFKAAGMKIALGLAAVLLTAAALYRGTIYMTPEREGWVARGRVPADSVSQGFDTKGRFRSLAQPLGRITDRNGTLLAGYRFDGHLKRAYPAGSTTAHIVGYWTGPLRDGMGLEKALVMVNDSLRDDRPHDLALTLDLRLQREAQRALAGRPGAVVVIDVSNGEVLTAANEPTFFPDSVWSDSAWARYVRDTVRRPLTSRAIKDNFSPGSSIKPLIAAAAIDLGKQFPERSGFVCTGSYVPVRNTKPITDHGSAHGAMDMAHAMRYSCNIYFSYLAYSVVGFDETEEYLGTLGFNERLLWNTGMFLNEFTTLLPARSWVKGRDEIAKSRLGIGQASVKTNPIHFTLLMAGIANGGRFLHPVLERGRRPDTLEWRMNPATARDLEKLLREPLLPGGTAARAFAGIERRGITLFGKTGTADREPDGREPSWFVSYGRKNGRAYAVAVAIQDRNGMYAGDLNAPIARRMYEMLDKLGYYK